METMACPVCTSPFNPARTWQKYCSRSCHTLYSNRASTENGRRGLKQCRTCLHLLPFDGFDQRARVCRECSALRADGRKRCTKCGQVKDRATCFYTRRNKDGHDSQCRECSAETSRRINAKPANRERKRSQHYMHRFGITAAEFDALAAAQDGLCSICRRPPNGVGPLHIDHDHACCEGEVTCGKCRRGLICNGCNFALGAIRDDPAIAHAMADYLRSYTHGRKDPSVRP